MIKYQISALNTSSFANSLLAVLALEGEHKMIFSDYDLWVTTNYESLHIY